MFKPDKHELKCSYGVAPWYCIARWTTENFAVDQYGKRHAFKTDQPSWVNPEGGGPFDEGSLQWRPYNGEVATYVDPTGGAQNDVTYWREAVARKYGVPLDHFEPEIEVSDVRAAIQVRPVLMTSPRKSLWQRLFGH